MLQFWTLSLNAQNVSTIDSKFSEEKRDKTIFFFQKTATSDENKLKRLQNAETICFLLSSNFTPTNREFLKTSPFSESHLWTKETIDCFKHHLSVSTFIFCKLCNISKMKFFSSSFSLSFCVVGCCLKRVSSNQRERKNYVLRRIRKRFGGVGFKVELLGKLLFCGVLLQLIARLLKRGLHFANVSNK